MFQLCTCQAVCVDLLLERLGKRIKQHVRKIAWTLTWPTNTSHAVVVSLLIVDEMLCGADARALAFGFIGSAACLVLVACANKIRQSMAHKDFVKDERGRMWRLPSRIILLRHGESLGNVVESTYREVPDWKIPLTEKGREQANDASIEIKKILGDRKAVFYYSPYVRTTQTLLEILKTIPFHQQGLVQEEPRIREQDFGNFQNSNMSKCKRERARFGRFFYRFPDGESCADLYDRMSSFFESLFRQFKRQSLCPQDEDYALILISHGITIRLFLMRWFHWTVEEFDYVYNPPNCKPIVMTRKPMTNEYEIDDTTWGRLGISGTPILQTRLTRNRLQFPEYYRRMSK